MRILGFLLLLAGLAAAFGRRYVDVGLSEGGLQPIGFALLAVGGVMVLLGGRRRRRRVRSDGDNAERVSKTSSIGYRRPDSEPKRRKPGITWGRDGDDG
ncbi:MAG: hypothetical protein Kow0026_05540 [Oricola sp.]